MGNEHFDDAFTPSQPTPDIFNDVEVWGGDCWLDLHSGAFMYPGYAHNESSIDNGAWEYGDFGFIMVFPTEQRKNYALRNAPSPGGPMSPHAGLRARSMFENVATAGASYWADKGLFHYSGRNGEAEDASRHLLEEFFINEVMGYRDKYRAFGTIPRGFKDINHWPQRWTYSQRKVYGDLVDSFREFLVNNWKDLEGQFGSIMGSIVHGDKLFSFQELAYGVLRVYERTMIPTTDGQVVTGDGSVIEGIHYRSESVGCHHPESIVAGEDRVYWVDAYKRAIYTAGTDGPPESLSDFIEMNQFLRELLWRYVDGRSIYGPKKLSIVAGYDSETGSVEFSFPARIEEEVQSAFPQPQESNRYRREFVIPVIESVNGLSHRMNRVAFIDQGSSHPLGPVSGVHYIGIREQDIVLMENTVAITTSPSAYEFNLYMGMYGSGTVSPRLLTVKEFYIAIRSIDKQLVTQYGWFAEFINRKEGNSTLSVSDILLPSATSLTEKEGYLYCSSNYATTVAQTKRHDGFAAVFHLFRPEASGPFQVRMIPAHGTLEDVLHGLGLRHKHVYNDKTRQFEGFESVADNFTIRHKGKLLTATENAVMHGMVTEHLRVGEYPQLYLKNFPAYLSWVCNENPVVNKIFDNLMVNMGSMDDVKDLRFSTEEQAIMITISTDTRKQYKRRLGALPIRRENQIDRMRGEYLVVYLEMESLRQRLAYQFASRTLYRISNKA